MAIFIFSPRRVCSRAGWILVGIAVFIGCGREDTATGDDAPMFTEACSPTAESAHATPRVALAATSSDKTIDADGDSQRLRREDEELSRFVPDWVADAVFYQIFPERFRNGDPTNDPTRESLEDPEEVSTDWRISPWTGDWYARADWEKASSDSFYEIGVYDRRYGGDLQGVLDKLDYLQDLGINAIYFNPVFYGKSMHKYDSASMHHIDPYFGPDPRGDLEQMARETGDPSSWHWTSADKLFLELIQQAHRRNIRLIIDGVFNHTGRDFFAFADILKNQAQSDYQDWYIIQQFEDPTKPDSEFRYKSWWGFDSLPEFADDDSRLNLHPGPKKYVFDITRRWMDPDGDGDPSDGIDGWRLDVANEVPMGFWREWNVLVRQLNPEAYTVGEFWEDASDLLVQGRFSGTMNYHGFAYLIKGFLVDGNLTPHDFGQQLQARLDDYPKSMQFALLNLVDSHDTDRIASMIVNAGRQAYAQADRFDYDVSERVSPRYTDAYDVGRPKDHERRIQRLVALMQMTYLGPPMIYYGTEAGMWGADDPCDRMPMVWSDFQYEDQAADPLGRERSPDPIHFEQKLFDFYQAAIRLRNNNTVLRRGNFKTIAYDDTAKFFAFRRRSGDHVVLVAINRGEEPFQWRGKCRDGFSMVKLFCASSKTDAIDVQQDGDHFIVTIPPLDAVVLSEQPEQE